MKLLILGANGFIGSWLSKIPGAIAPQIRFPNYNLEEYFKQYDPTHIVFSLGRPSISQSFIDPKGDFKFVLYLQSVLKATKATVIFLSSQAVYQEKTPFAPTSEEDATEPISPYGWNKLLSEKLLEQYSIPYVVLRIFSCYGEGQKNLLFWDIMNKPNLELQTDGQEIRDYIHVSDVARAVEFVAQNNLKNITLNLASGEGTNIIKVAQMLRPETPTFLNQPSIGIKKIVANINKLKNLGFNHSIKLDEGIERYKSWYKVQKCP